MSRTVSRGQTIPATAMSLKNLYKLKKEYCDEHRRLLKENLQQELDIHYTCIIVQGLDYNLKSEIWLQSNTNVSKSYFRGLLLLSSV